MTRQTPSFQLLRGKGSREESYKQEENTRNVKIGLTVQERRVKEK